MIRFEQFMGLGSAPFRVFFAPGRVNLIGEHTDYTGGYVFPAALHFGTWLGVRPRTDGRYRFISTSSAKRVERDTLEMMYLAEDGWSNYPKGVIWMLQQQGFELPGYDFIYYGNIPSGAGLSSSASITMVTALAMRELENLPLTTLDLVKLAQQVENHYLGVNCGIMDQFAVGMGKENQAMLLCCETMEYAYFPLDLGEYRLVIINSNKRRELTESKYNQRRSECEAGFQILQSYLPNIRNLGSVSLSEWEQCKGMVAEQTIQNRLEHVIQENHRVKRSAEALSNQDLTGFGQLMNQSHESLRDLYEVTGKELDALVEAAWQVEGCIGARMTGAGFGGCTVNLVKKEQIEPFRLNVTEAYRAKIGMIPDFYDCEIGNGAREIKREVEICPFW